MPSWLPAVVRMAWALSICLIGRGVEILDNTGVPVACGTVSPAIACDPEDEVIVAVMNNVSNTQCERVRKCSRFSEYQVRLPSLVLSLSSLATCNSLLAALLVLTCNVLHRRLSKPTYLNLFALLLGSETASC
jgi:hypothetical protein